MGIHVYGMIRFEHIHSIMSLMDTSYRSLDMKETHHMVVLVAIKQFQGGTKRPRLPNRQSLMSYCDYINLNKKFPSQESIEAKLQETHKNQALISSYWNQQIKFMALFVGKTGIFIPKSFCFLIQISIYTLFWHSYKCQIH